MKIVFVSRLFLPHLGGVEIHLKEVSAILTRMGHEVSIITSQHDKKLALQTEYEGVKIFRIPCIETNVKKNTWNELKKYSQIFLDADIVHVHDVFWWIVPFYFKIRKKLFTTFHGWETDFPISSNSKIHRFIASFLSKKTVHVGHFIQKFYWDKPNFVVYGGINPKRFTRINPQNSQKAQQESSSTNKHANGNASKNITLKEFVFVGRLDPDTDVLLYIEFLKQLKRKKIKFKMTWVGDGSLQSVCAQVGEVTGFVKNISKYIVNAELVFASSYLSILEAQMLEKVVCAFYSNPLKKEYLEQYPGSKYMLISGSVKNMIKKMELLYASSVTFQKTKNDAKNYASQQTWKSVVDIYLKMYE